MTTTDDLAAMVRDEAERCGIDVRELARVLLGWTAMDLRRAEVAVALRYNFGRIGVTRGIVHDDASPPAAPGGDE